MSAATVIDHLAVRWRLLDASLRDQARVDRLSRALAAGPLAAAIAAGAEPGEVTCIRAVEVPPLRIAADVTDDELLSRLAAAIAAAVATAVSDTGAQSACIRYRSRGQAALDLTVSLARGDHHREWAWRQLGLWPAPGEPADAGQRVAAALAEVPETVTGLLSAAAGAGALGFLAALIGPGRLDAVVRAAWTAHGCPLPDWDNLLGPAAAAPDDAGFAQVTALLGRSALGRELLGGAALPPQAAAAASTAALLDGEPSLALRPPPQVMPLVTAAALVSLGRRRRHRDGESRGPGARMPEAGEARGVPQPQPDDAQRPPAATPRGDRSAGLDLASGVATEFGGLPFLLHLVGRVGLPERVARGELADSGLTRVLYETGLRVLGRLHGPGQAPDRADAALACVCGRAPEARWPHGIDRGEPDPALSAVADSEAERLIAALRAAVEPSGLAALPEQDLLSAVCRRRGRITADPGWIDVHLDLDEVSTEVRQAGLDLDLGYLAWLGCVVRFVYE